MRLLLHMKRLRWGKLIYLRLIVMIDFLLKLKMNLQPLCISLLFFCASFFFLFQSYLMSKALCQSCLAIHLLIFILQVLFLHYFMLFSQFLAYLLLSRKLYICWTLFLLLFFCSSVFNDLFIEEDRIQLHKGVLFFILKLIGLAILYYFLLFIIILGPQRKLSFRCFSKFLTSSFAEFVKAAVPSYSFAAITLLQAVSPQTFLGSELPPHFFYLEDCLSFSHEKVEANRNVGLFVVQDNIFESKRIRMILSEVLIDICINVGHRLFFIFLVCVEPFGKEGTLLYFFVAFCVSLHVDESLLHLLAEVDIFIFDLVFDFLRDGEGDLCKGGGAVLAAVSQHFSQVVHIKLQIRINKWSIQSESPIYHLGSFTASFFMKNC